MKKSRFLSFALFASAHALAHDSFPQQIQVNRLVDEAERNSSKLNFLADRSRRLGVSTDLIERASGTFYDRYRWTKTKLSVCFWNGTEAQQREIMDLAEVWHAAVPRIEFAFESGGKVRMCQLSDLSSYKLMADIRINLDAGDKRALWNQQDIPVKNGDWSYVGKAVYQNTAFPTTMNLVGALRAKKEGLMTGYVFNVRHEFGHALAMVHEHQRKLCDGWFNIPAIAASQGWKVEYAKAQIGSLGDTGNTYFYVGGYDNKSIMQYNFAPSWYAPDRNGQKNPCRRDEDVDDLSELDKISVAQIYDPSLNDTAERKAYVEKLAIGFAKQAENTAQAEPSAQEKSRAEASLNNFGEKVRVPERITIQVYPHKVDQDIVLQAVSNLGYPLKDRSGQRIRTISKNPTPSLKGDPTTTVLYTADVSDIDARFVAANLLRAGIAIKSIQQYYPTKTSNFAKRDHLIQIGADVRDRNRMALTYDDIMTLPLPMFGKKQ
ncbi:M12 family metallopeptidase [Massilia sp. Root418]|jgi:hypothetical protein|uniref:M12 family metallopeptidase n=1 Tax=Massilia sp. Root418 TaxID=1736532 RepID=UPI0006FCF03F|nr:M12 family metallopeptidase [Massilia sp. Root418]